MACQQSDEWIQTGRVVKFSGTLLYHCNPKGDFMPKKEIIRTDQAPAAVGPYSQAIKTEKLVFVSGQIPIDPASGEVVKGEIQAQTRQVLKNLKTVLSAAGTSLENVVKTTVFITEMNDFPLVNDVYAEFFPTQPPARACVEVSKLPKAVNVEIDAIALC